MNAMPFPHPTQEYYPTQALRWNLLLKVKGWWCVCVQPLVQYPSQSRAKHNISNLRISNRNPKKYICPPHLSILEINIKILHFYFLWFSSFLLWISQRESIANPQKQRYSKLEQRNSLSYAFLLVNNLPQSKLISYSLDSLSYALFMGSFSFGWLQLSF